MRDGRDLALDDGGQPSTEEAARQGDFVVDIDGYEGPLDLLLTLAREQKVDLKQISILELADQYLAFISAAREADLDLAAEYLIMAAWLAYLKSKLLVPQAVEGDGASPEEMANVLSLRLAQLEAMRTCAEKLMTRPRLGRDFFARGCPPRPEREPSVVAVDLQDILKSYRDMLRRNKKVDPLSIGGADHLSSVEDAIARFRRCLGQVPGWESLTRYLPEETLAALRDGALSARSQLAATFSAGLELAKQNEIQLRQMRLFGPIYVKARDRRQEPNT